MIDPEALATPTAALDVRDPGTIRALRIDVIAGPDAGREYRNTSDRVVVGTHPTADFVLADRTVSRFHLELVIEDDAVALRDLGSRNRTLLDSVEIGNCRLRGPAIVTLGTTELRIDLLGETIAMQLAPQEQLGELVGVSAAMRSVFTRLVQLCPFEGCVLVEGERGTGKDLAVAALHELGPRRDKALDVIDCRGPALEVEACLFGGSGAIARARGGTLVLDEIGALRRTAQRELSRALAQGGVRLLAMSRSNLRVDVNTERFDPDLFAQLSAARVRMPPLREHPEDIPLLVTRFLAALGASGTRSVEYLLTPEVVEQLRAAPWPGNVRELRSHVEQTVLADGAPAADATSPALIDTSVTLREARERWVRYLERSYVSELLAKAHGNVSIAAARAGVDRVYMHRLITRAGLRDVLQREREES